MKMGEILIGLIFTISIFGPLVYIYHLANKSKLRIENELKKLAKKHDLKLSELEVWDSKGIGLDRLKKSLIFISILNDIVTEEYVNILDVNDIKLINNAAVVAIQIRKNSEELVKLEFYNSIFDQPLNAGFHTILAKKWVDSINDFVKASPKKAA